MCNGFVWNDPHKRFLQACITSRTLEKKFFIWCQRIWTKFSENITSAFLQKRLSNRCIKMLWLSAFCTVTTFLTKRFHSLLYLLSIFECTQVQQLTGRAKTKAGRKLSDDWPTAHHQLSWCSECVQCVRQFAVCAARWWPDWGVERCSAHGGLRALAWLVTKPTTLLCVTTNTDI